MGLKHQLKDFVYKTDFFHTKELLRHRHQTEYRTLCGGYSSIVIILALIIIFYQKMFDTFQRSLISATLNNIYSMQPTPLSLSTYEDGKFMLALQIMNHNLNDEKIYFSIDFINRKMLYGAKTQGNQFVSMEPCTKDHWKNSPQVVQRFQVLGMENWRCLPLNSTYLLEGKYSSKDWSFLQFRVRKCTNQSDESIPCASEEQIEALFEQNGVFALTVYFINPIINPTEKNFIGHYLEDKYYISFSKKFGGQALLYMQDYKITTDESILPYSSQTIQTGGIIVDAVAKDMFQTMTDVYATVLIFKSVISKEYERRFYKVDQLFSYIGGLFETILMILFLVSVYNNYSLVVSLGGFLFNHENKKLRQENIFKKYNFFNFLINGIYNFFTMIGLPPNWKISRQFHKCRQEMIRQLDVQFIIRRIIFLENFMKLILQQHQIKGLFLQEKNTIDDARKMRRYFKLKRRIGKNIKCTKQKYKEKSQFIGNDQSFNVFPSKVMNSFEIESATKLEEKKPKKKDRQIFSLFQRKHTMSKAQQSESDSGCSSDSEESSESDQVIQEISQLKEEAEQGQQLSMKIWQKVSDSIKTKIALVINENKLNPSENQSPENRRIKTHGPGADYMLPALSIDQLKNEPAQQAEEMRSENLRQSGYRGRVAQRNYKKTQLTKKFQEMNNLGGRYQLLLINKYLLSQKNVG